VVILKKQGSELSKYSGIKIIKKFAVFIIFGSIINVVVFKKLKCHSILIFCKKDRA
jgi:hypothetical protein